MQDRIEPNFDSSINEEEILASQDIHSIPRDEDMLYLYDENQKLKQELEYTRNISQKNFEQNVTQFAETALDKYKQAENNYRIALASDDKELIANSSIALNHATVEVNEAQRYLDGLRDDVNNSSNYSQNNDGDQSDTPSLIDDWLTNYPELRSNSSRYNPDIAQKLMDFSNKVEERYQSEGREDLIGSKHYVAQLDKFMKAINQNNNMNLVYQNRNSSAIPSNTRGRFSPEDVKELEIFKLTPAQMLANLGITEEQFFKYNSGEYNVLERTKEFDRKGYDY